VVYHSKTSLISRFVEGQVWSVHELFGYMELSILAIVSGEPSMNQFPYRAWEGISPREEVESVFLQSIVPSVVDCGSLQRRIRTFPNE
jgi:hypothetical protein